jgi:hypothetical protein
MAGYKSKEEKAVRKALLALNAKESKANRTDYNAEILPEINPQAQLVEAGLLMAAMNGVASYTSSEIGHGADAYNASVKPKNWVELMIIINDGKPMSAYVE